MQPSIQQLEKQTLDGPQGGILWKVGRQCLSAHALWNPFPEPSACFCRDCGQKQEPVGASIWKVSFPLCKTKDLEQTHPM